MNQPHTHALAVRFSYVRCMQFALAVMFAWLYSAGPAAAATITYVQGNYATPQTAQTTVNVTFTAAQAVGDLNVVVVGWNDSTAAVSSVVDKSGNAYTLAVGPTAFTDQLTQSVYYAKNIKAAAAGANTVTVTFSPAAAYPDIRILEYKGADPNSPVDVTAAATGNSTVTNSGSATTTNATDLIFGASMVGTFTTGPGTGFTQRLLTNPDGDIAEDKAVTTAGSYNATTAALSPAGPWIMQMVAFRTPLSGAGTASAFSNTATITTQNPVIIENQQSGSSNWNIGDYFFKPEGTDSVGQIKGYASATSVNKGQNITFYVSVNPAQTYTIDVYRVGWYQGLGGRLMQHIGPLNGVQQPACPRESGTGKTECQWAPSYTLTTQTSWTSGIYLAVLSNANGYYNYMVFCVRDDSRVAALLYMQGVSTDNAYNDWGGWNLYTSPQAYKVSFDRPYGEEGSGNFLWLGEMNLVRWLEMNGYDVTYSTDVDTQVNPSMLLNYRGVLIAGHNEYWSKQMYDAVTAARDAGVNLAFFGSNPIYWQVRYESSSSGVANRVVVCYKSASLDPTTDPTLTTVNWRDPLLNRPEQVLIGVQYTSQPNANQVTYVVTNSSNWVYAGTGFKDGDTVAGIVGYEADRQFTEYPTPAAVAGTYTLLSHSPYPDKSNNPDFQNSSIYQAQSGAWVFASGTMAWTWALDNYYPDGYQLPYVDSRIQQTTTNILNKFVTPH